LTSEDSVGESYYNPLLPAVVEDLARQGLLVESDGALCVFPPGFKNREGAPLPLIIQNSAGGFTYAATDLAAIRDRVGRIGAKRLVYVVGLPQSEHFQMVFATARLAGWLPEGTEAVHVGFGNVLGPDGKMLRTREGEAVKLGDLLDEAVTRARAVVTGREAEGLSPDEVESVAYAVGVGAVKYADLSTDRARDYRFDWDRMLALSGNSAPYLQYAHARTCRIFRRAAEQGIEVPSGPRAILPPGTVEEHQLAMHLLGFADAVDAALESYSPHKLCNYLFELAGAFTTFYEQCPVLRAEPEGLRGSRLALCRLTGAVLRRGLGLLGIEAPERM
jgi:arginyl-tRNA synthetase